MNVFAAEEIGARIAQARTEAGLTQDDLADLIDLSMRQVQNLESGFSKPYKHLKEIATVTGKDFDWFLRGEDGNEDETTEARLARIEEALEQVGELREAVDRIETLLEALQPRPAASPRSRRAKPSS